MLDCVLKMAIVSSFHMLSSQYS